MLCVACQGAAFLYFGGFEESCGRSQTWRAAVAMATRSQNASDCGIDHLRKSFPCQAVEVA